MNADMSLVSLILEASLLVQIVMAILVLASVMSWIIIFSKRGLIRRTKAASDDFESNFWSGGDLNTLYRDASRRKGGSLGMASIFEAGFREFTRLKGQADVTPAKVVEECQRAMRVAQLREVDRLKMEVLRNVFYRDIA